jgi:hypothetical protein
VYMIRIDLQANAVSALYGQHVHPHHALQHVSIVSWPYKN